MTCGAAADSGELRYLPEKDLFALTLRTTGKDTLTFSGPLKEKKLTLEREHDGRRVGLVQGCVPCPDDAAEQRGLADPFCLEPQQSAGLVADHPEVNSGCS